MEIRLKTKKNPEGVESNGVFLCLFRFPNGLRMSVVVAVYVITIIVQKGGSFPVTTERYPKAPVISDTT